MVVHERHENVDTQGLSSLTTTAVEQRAPYAAAFGDGPARRTQVLTSLIMAEGLTLATLFDALGRADITAHVMREVWEGENDGDRDLLPRAHRTDGTRLPFRTRQAPTPDYLFTPRADWAGGTWYCDLCDAPACAGDMPCPRCGIGTTTTEGAHA